MIIRWVIYGFLIFAGTVFGVYIFQDKKTGRGADSKVKYEIVTNWPKLPINFRLGNPTGIGIGHNHKIYVFHRASRKWPFIGAMPKTYIKEKTILEIDNESGKILNSWGDNIFIMPHGLTVDSENNIWVTDVGLNQVFKFNQAGKLLIKLGEAGVKGSDSRHFNKPTDVAVCKDGSFYVSDGYGNSRVVKFSSKGEYLFEWGKKGNKNGEFNIPHGICIDSDDNVYVADRENRRVQKFDKNGKFLRAFADKSFANICSVTSDSGSGRIYAIDDLTFLKIKHRGSDVIAIDTAGLVQTRFGRSGSYNGSTCWYHDIAIDSEQNIYVTDILRNRIQKFRVTKGAIR